MFFTHWQPRQHRTHESRGSIHRARLPCS